MTQLKKRESVKEVLMRRDGMTAKEADKLIDAMLEDFHHRIDSGEMPFDICEEYFGLEPDYLEEFM